MTGTSSRSPHLQVGVVHYCPVVIQLSHLATSRTYEKPEGYPLTPLVSLP